MPTSSQQERNHNNVLDDYYSNIKNIKHKILTILDP